ncbi:uncharacterized protein LOC134541910 [Bacillus rossius redtenbacheri]|uniref:uncharacterized protein LOC134541910 n=1 Tax=Bacillus rossius redtenbacheri TaxID=93214 RepID=UPI002FDCBC3F
MADEQFGISRNERRVIEAAAQRRAALRQEYWKLISDPHRHATGQGGTVFDTGLQRFTALRATQYDHFKPTPKSAFMGMLIVVPIILYAWILKSHRDSWEKKYRTGEVAYKDRRFKFV